MKLISKIERRDLVPRKSYESDKMKQNAGESSKRVLIGTIYFIAFALTWLVKTREYPTDFLSMSVSVGLLGIGGLIWIAGRFSLGRAHSTVAKAQALVTDGIYSKIRHPIYTGLQLVSWGLCLWFGSLIGLAASFILVLPLSVRRARTEERILERAFGLEYAEYKARTWF